MPPKQLVPHTCKCYFKCGTKFTMECRQTIFDNYYSLGSYERQRDFILNNIVQREVKTKKESSRPREKAYEYYFKMHDKKERVCQGFVTATLCITRKTIRVALEKISKLDNDFVMADRRGTQKGKSFITKYFRGLVMKHIESFPAVEGHYIRKSSKRKYLAEDLSISKMHAIYMEENKDDNKAHVKLCTYRHIFNTNYNLSFHIPKKDLCLTCTKLKRNITNGTSEALKAHLAEKDRAQAEKHTDKMRAKHSHLTFRRSSLHHALM